MWRLLAWSARFAFVTAAPAAERWGVSEQRMRARLRRLERERAGAASARRAERAGARRGDRGGRERWCGLAVRTPRGREPLGHELAVIKRVIAIERHFAEHGPAEARVLTERDMRREQRAAGGRAGAVEVVRARGRRGRRWADYAVDDARRGARRWSWSSR